MPRSIMRSPGVYSITGQSAIQRSVEREPRGPKGRDKVTVTVGRMFRTR